MNRLTLVPLLVMFLSGCNLSPTLKATTVLMTPTQVTQPPDTPLVTATPTSDATSLGIAAKDPLDNTRWVLLFLYSKPPLEGTHVTLEFSGGFIRGFAGCNKYDRMMIGDDMDSARYKTGEDGSLTVPRLTITALSCLTPQGVNDQEDIYLKALHSAVGFRLVENHLELQDITGETVLVFTR